MTSPRVALLRGMVLGASLLAVASPAFANSQFVPLVPMPREVESRPGSASLGPEWTVSATSAEDDQAVRLLVREAADCYRWTWRVVPAGTQLRTVELRAIAPPAGCPALFAEQGYRLEITREHVVIEGATAQGRFYGAQTLRQLLRAHPDGVIPCVGIEDYPALAWRGISDDISRGQVSTIEDFKAIIRQLAYYKINLYQLYIEDMYRFEGSATSGQTRGALTRGDLEQLVTEGLRNHVVVSPIFETLAHQERLLSLKEHRRYAAADAEERGGAAPEDPWGMLVRVARDVFGRLVMPGGAETAAPAAFSAGNEHALHFAQSLVDEIAAVTRGPFFHIGGDEWQPPTAPAGAAATAADDGMRSYGHYLGRIADHLGERYGCRAMVYGDVILEHPEAARDLPRDVIVVDWHYDPQDSFPSLRQIKDQGFRDVMVSPGLWTWRTFYPNYASGFSNVASFAQAGKRERALGCVTAAWGDGGAENLRENNWAGYAFSAAASWEQDAPPADSFLRRFVVAHYGIDSPELARAERLLGWQEFENVGWAGRLYHRPLPVRARPQRWVERMNTLDADMRQVQQDLAAIEAEVRFNREHLAAARHCARRYGYVAERELLLDAIGRRLEGRTAAQLSQAERDQLARELGRLETTANALQAEFGLLWLRHNRPEGLAENEGRMAKQGAMLGRLRELARSGSLRVDDSYSHMQALNAAPDPAEVEGSRR
jgi:hypothetical protein